MNTGSGRIKKHVLTDTVVLCTLLYPPGVPEARDSGDDETPVSSLLRGVLPFQKEKVQQERDGGNGVQSDVHRHRDPHEF